MILLSAVAICDRNEEATYGSDTESQSEAPIGARSEDQVIGATEGGDAPQALTTIDELRVEGPR